MASTLLALLALLSLAATAATAAAALAPTDPSAASQLSPEHLADLLSDTLAELGYQELSSAVKPFYQANLSLAALSGPVTVFAPSDDAFRRSQYSPLLLLSVHLAPGLLPAADLAQLPSGSKLETAGLLVEGRWLTVTSAGSKIFIDGAEITRPDLFNDGRIAIHGLGAVVHPLSPGSYVHDPSPSTLLLQIALDDLENSGYEMLAVEMSLMETELAKIRNMTVFALDDQTLLAGRGSEYINGVQFHLVPDRLLTHADLARLPKGTVLRTLKGTRLVVTRSGAAGADTLKINGVPIKAPDVYRNARIVVHRIPEPFFPVYTAADEQLHQLLVCFLFMGIILLYVTVLLAVKMWRADGPRFHQD